MPTVHRDSRGVHYSRTGSGPGVVLVPGLGSGGRLFGTLPRRFEREGFTCAAIDPVGMPPSSVEPGDYDFAAAAADLLAVVAELPPPVSLVGTSLGGKVALFAAAMQPAAVHRLVLLCSSAVVTPRARSVYRFFELLASAVAPELLGELTAPFLFGDSFHNARPAVVADIVRAAKPTPAGRALMLSQARALQQFDGESHARGCTVPTLCLAGAEDTLTLPHEVARTAALLPRGEYREIAGAGHSLLLEDASAFTAVVEFLRRRAGA